MHDSLNTQRTDPLKHLYKAYYGRYAPHVDVIYPSSINDLKALWDLLQRKLSTDKQTIANNIAELMILDVCSEINDVPRDIVQLLSSKKAIEHFAIPIAKDGKGFVQVAIANPFDEELISHLSFVFNQHFQLLIAPPDDIELAISKYYESIDGDEVVDALNLDKAGDEQANGIPELAQKIFIQAIDLNASDIHIQPFIDGSAVRVRTDGVLRRIAILPESVSKSVIRYVKNQSGMDSTTTFIPQDGRMAVEYKGQLIDVRLSVLPVAGRKEKLVIRLLHQLKDYSLNTIGLSLKDVQTLRRLLTYPSGVVLVCGPTGSGKSTTLYAALSELNKESVSIATVEEPVEYKMPGLAQTDVNPKTGLTFAGALRSVLRQDPDIVLVGEIRDQETATTAMQAALTGHLVLSTLHTNDAITAIPRLQDLNIQSSIMAEALNGIISQRLFRKLCDHCKLPNEGNLSGLDAIFEKITHVRPPYRANGCEKCYQSGYKGRIPITEIIEINTKMRTLIHQEVSDVTKLITCVNDNYSNLSMTTSRRIISGETSVEEAIKVIGHVFISHIAQGYDSDVDNSSELLNSMPTVTNSGAGVLIVGDVDIVPDKLKTLLSNAWYRVNYASTPKQAETMLKTNSNISLVVLAISEQQTEQQAVSLTADYREALAWSRLPALIFLQSTIKDYAQGLVEHGATSKIVASDQPNSHHLELIQSAIEHNDDFNWGIVSNSDQITFEH